MHGYIAVVVPRRSGGYRVEFPDLPGCRCPAAGVEEALARAQRALATYVAALHRQGLGLPPARAASELVREARRHGAVATACLLPPSRGRPARREERAPAAEVASLRTALRAFHSHSLACL